MTAISASTSSFSPAHLPGISGAKAAQSSSAGAAGGSSSSGAGASGDTTTITTNADGSLTITLTNAQGQIVSTSSEQASGGQSGNRAMSGLAQGGGGPAGSASSLLNMLV
jgi:hypothetical protein